MAGNAIIADELAYWYDKLTAVDHISFTVSEGEILGFLGPNGAGKTTTVKMLTGQLKPKSGKAMLLDMDIAKNVDKVQGDTGCRVVPKMPATHAGLEEILGLEETLDMKELIHESRDHIRRYVFENGELVESSKPPDFRPGAG